MKQTNKYQPVTALFYLKGVKYISPKIKALPDDKGNGGVLVYDQGGSLDDEFDVADLKALCNRLERAEAALTEIATMLPNEWADEARFQMGQIAQNALADAKPQTEGGEG